MPAFTDDQKALIEKLRSEGMLHREIAVELSISEDGVRRYLRDQGFPGKIPRSFNRKYTLADAAADAGSAKDREIVRLRDEVSRLKSEIQNAHRTALLEDEMRRLLGVMGQTKSNPPSWLATPKRTRNAPEVPVTIWSDWHAGEVVSAAEVNGLNEFNMAVLEERVRRLVERTLRLADKHNGTYPGIVVNLLGDFVSGGLHPELAKTDEVESISASLAVRDLLIWALGAIADRFGKVYVPCAAGNHGRNTLRPEFKRYIYKNFDWMIYKLLEKHFVDDPRVTFKIRPANEVFYRVWDKRFLAMHGDMLGVKGGDGIIGAIGPIMRGDTKVRGATSAITQYDYLLMGHWHQPLWLPRVVVAGTLKGYDEYAKNALRAPYTAPSQPLFFVHPHYGITARYEIYLTDTPPSASEKTEWVSVFKSEAIAA